MAADSSTPGSLNADVPGNEAGNKARKRREGRPLPYWIMLITALLGGAMLSVLMVMATTLGHRHRRERLCACLRIHGWSMHRAAAPDRWAGHKKDVATQPGVS